MRLQKFYLHLASLMIEAKNKIQFSYFNSLLTENKKAIIK